LFEDRREMAKRSLKLERPADYEDFEKLLASDVDAVIIATPPFEHPRMLAAAVEAKKHIYCEKPMGVDVEGCKNVMAAGRRCDPKKNISVGFQQRYGPVYQDAYKRVVEGQIGDLVTARAYWIGGGPFILKPDSHPGIGKVGEEFVGRKGMITTSRGKTVFTPAHDSDQAETTVTLNSRHDITVDAFQSFLDRVVSGKVENVAERSALSTGIAILGRTAIYSRKEATWKDVIGL